MTLQDWSNVAQVIGAIAVVVSLFYVGFQIKRNTSAVRSATAQAIHNNYGDWYMNLMCDARAEPDCDQGSEGLLVIE